MATDKEQSQERRNQKKDNATSAVPTTQAVTASEDSPANPWIASHPKLSKKSTSESRIEKIQKKRKRDELDTPEYRLNIDLAVEKINERLTADTKINEDEEAPTMTYGRGKIAFQQAELLNRALASDGFEAQFAAEKEAAISEDAPKEEDLTLPGWGAWTGQGVKKRATEKKLIKKIPGIEQSQRKDAKLKHVIINEKTSKAVCSVLCLESDLRIQSTLPLERSPIHSKLESNTNAR
jgi:U3 small nucleolar RNA-associated protein 14